MYVRRWDCFVINACISFVTGLDNICSIIRLKLLCLLGHVAKLDRAVPAWKALDLKLITKSGFSRKPGWGRPRVRPQRIDYVKEDTAAPLDSLCLAADRQAWRSLRYVPLPTFRS